MKVDQRGFSAVELVVTMAIFTVLLLIVTMVQQEVLKVDRSIRLRWSTHPDRSAVSARLRRDVLGSSGYPSNFQNYVQSPSVLLLSGFDEKTGERRTVIYDFRTEGVARRLEYSGEERISSWTARAVPQYAIDAIELPDGSIATRLTAKDRTGKQLIEQIHVPRLH